MSVCHQNKLTNNNTDCQSVTSSLLGLRALACTLLCERSGQVLALMEAAACWLFGVPLFCVHINAVIPCRSLPPPYGERGGRGR